MISSLTVIALIIILFSAGLLLFFSLQLKRRPRWGLRPLTAFSALSRAIGLSVEEGTRLHLTLGNAGITQPHSASALVGLQALGRITAVSSISDRPPLATSGEGSLALLSQSTLRATYRLNNALDLYDPNRGRLTGVTPLSYIAGAIPIAYDEDVSTHLMIGHYGPEIGLLCEAATRNNAFTLAASDSLDAQAVLFAAAQHPLIGEELFAAPAYLQTGSAHLASVRVQDILRWGVIVALILSALLGGLGWL
ncbi:MAG: DUF6754 domain-containing protein [Thermanaerothrix sp.]|uniref:DUF6754 domain-containing protein n=1 Tax=Thermanaerothrix solaris TaxID=3058434 RepID=A0ABU3NR56_9CHLR|nr:DUF6754 domain-containing protein [Thermanaerothrix sp. 4228-RoL]MDT8899323.1 hypothetical protein [Thermanaerothrix sp. 4228-RoL]